MRKITFLFFILRVDSQSTVDCLASKGPAKFGKLSYVENTLESCVSLLEKDHAVGQETVTLSDCDETVPTRKSQAEKNIDCKTDNSSADCPTAPEGCTGDGTPSPSGSDHICHYECTTPELACSSGFTYAIDMTTSFICFDKYYDSCEFESDIAENDQVDQIIKTCSQDNCGYTITDDLPGTAETTFVDSAIKITYTVSSRSVENIFGCTNLGKTPSGCDCSFTESTLFTWMSCPEDAYTNKCSDITDFCKDNKCYNGEPIMEYEYDNCDIEEKGLNYCKQDEKVYLPCGDVKHECAEQGSTGVFDCTCFELPSASCNSLGGVFTEAETNPISKPSECLIEDINTNYKMMTCEEMNCFNSTYFQEDCKFVSSEFVSTYWQCYDDFSFFEVTNPTAANGYNKAEEKKGTYENLAECVVNEWQEGQYTCEDTALSKSENYCDSYVDYYVEKKPAARQLFTNAPPVFEFKCLSFNSTFNAVNDINNDLGKESRCYELKVNKTLVTCPNIGGCSTVAKKTDNLPDHGFYECKCDEKCSYQCASSKYDPVFPANFTGEQQEARDFTTYECEKDNLVMIICTSIFVPLGVAGIAAGVYFFFFHESSEVAPVETDNELAATESSEDKPAVEDKEETKSEIQNDN